MGTGPVLVAGRKGNGVSIAWMIACVQAGIAAGPVVEMEFAGGWKDGGIDAL